MPRRPRLGEKITKRTTSEIVGRDTEFEVFKDSLDRTIKLSKQKNVPDEEWVYPHVFLITGLGGMGKTTLLDSFMAYATTKKVVTATIDADQLSIVSAETFMQKLHDKISAQNKEDHKLFTLYRDALTERDDALTSIKEQSVEPKTKFEPLVNTGAKAIGAWTGPAAPVTEEIVKLVVNNGATGIKNIADNLRQIGQISQKQHTLIRDLSTVSENFMNCLANIGEKRVLVIAIDTYEKLDTIHGFDKWFREQLIGDSSSEIIWIIAGRETNKFITRYKETLGEERYLASMSLTKLTKSQIKIYLENKALLPNSEDDISKIIDFVDEISYGIPLAVKAVSDLLQQGFDIDALFTDIKKQKYLKKHAFKVLTYRFLHWTNQENAENSQQVLELASHRKWIQAISLLNTYDQKAIRKILDQHHDKIVPNDPEELIRYLGNRYSFILAKDGVEMHDVVKDAVRADLRSNNLPLWISEVANTLFLYYKQQRRSIEEHSNIDKIELIGSSTWQELAISEVNFAYWTGKDGVIGIQTLTAIATESLMFDRDFTVTLIENMAEFEDVNEYSASIFKHWLAFAQNEEKDNNILEVMKRIKNDKGQYPLSDFGYACSMLIYTIELADQDKYREAAIVISELDETYADKLSEKFKKRVSFFMRRIAIDFFMNDDSHKINDKDKALCYSLVNRAIELSPTSPDVYTKMGFLNYMDNNLGDAIQNYNRALQIDDEHIIPNYRIGEAFIDAGQYDLAVKYLNKAIELDENFPPAYLGLSRLAIQKEIFDEAIEHLRMGIEKNSGFLPFYDMLSNIYESLEQYDKAVAVLEEFIDEDPEAIKSIYPKLINLYADSGDKESIDKLSRKLILQDQDFAPGYLGMAIKSQMEDSLPEAIEWTNKAIAQDQEFGGAYLMRAEMYLAMDSQHLAMSDLNNAIVINPENVKALSIRSNLLQSKHKFTDALSDIDLALQSHPDKISLTLQKVEILELVGHYEDALELINNIVRNNPNEYNLLVIRSSVYSLMGQFEMAEMDLKNALALSSEKDWLIGAMSLVKSYKGNYEVALDILEEANNLDELAHYYNSIVLKYLTSDQKHKKHIIRDAEVNITNFENSVSRRAKGKELRDFQADITYAKAGLDALSGKTTRALNRLDTAAKGKPSVVLWARLEPAWRELHNDEKFNNIVNFDLK